MKQGLSAARVVLWLFPVVAIALVVGVIVGIVTLVGPLGGGTTLLTRWIVGPLVIAIGFGAWSAFRNRPEPSEGIEIAEDRHPGLWAEVRSLAAVAETDPPARILLTPEVNASVTEVSGPRELVIGLPILATFTVGELRSVLAHELGHFAGGDTAAAARTMRHVFFLYRVRERVGPLWRWFFTAYAHVYALAAAPASRAAELRADDLSVQAAGPDAAIESFRSMVRADLAWGLLTERFLPLFELAGKRASVGQALREIIAANPGIESAVDEVIATETPSATDTHPPIRERLARFEAARTHTVASTANAEPATSLLGGGDDWLDSAEAQLLTRDWPLAGWSEVVSAAVRESIDVDTDALGAGLRRLSLGSGSLDSVLRLLDDRRDGVIRLVGGEDDDARDITIANIATAVTSALLASGAARVELHWDGPAVVVSADGGELHVEDRVTAAVDAGDSSTLRSWLADVGVDVEATHTTSLQTHWLAAVSQMSGPWKGRRDVHLWSTGVLALPQLDPRVVKEAKDQFSEKHQHPRLYEAAASGLDAGRVLEDSLWWDADDIVSADIGGRMKTRLRFGLRDDTAIEMTSTLETATVGSPEELVDAVSYLGSPKHEA